MVVNEEKLAKLKKDIEDTNNELLKEIANVISNGGQLGTYEHLKQMQLQCAAQLRLIKHIENDFSNSTGYIIC